MLERLVSLLTGRPVPVTPHAEKVRVNLRLSLLEERLSKLDERVAAIDTRIAVQR